jgi:trehalose 6-phosphate synthase
MSATGRIILVSNRGPVQYGREEGERTATRGAGGLVTALSGLSSQLQDGVWVCAAMSDEDVVVAQESPGGLYPPELGDDDLRVRLVALDPEAQDAFYTVIANPLLWFIQHHLYDLKTAPNITRREIDAFESGYAAVNRRFAEVVAEEVAAAGGDAVVMVHDYHFYLLPAEVRRRCPGVVLHHFVHIPWPGLDAWRVLPPPMRDAVFRGLLGNDVVGFHTESYARNFLLGCQEFLHLSVDLSAMEVVVDGRVVRARWYPISIDPEAFEAMAESPAVLDQERELAARRGDYLLLRVDRTDPSKNIVRGFLAYDLLLRDHPELAERITFLALLQPSRQDVAEYADYVERIQATVDEINDRHGTGKWQPVELHMEDNFDLAIAAYKQFDALMVNAMFDGMNLVAKEAIVVNRRDGVLALSENTGAHAELGAFAVTLHPFDLQQQADALYEALTMPADERRDRREACVRVVQQNDVTKWLQMQLADISRAAEGMTLPATFADDPGRCAVIVDFDGTLAPIVADPPAATPLPEAAATLGRLARRFGRVAVVSGRPVEFLRERLPVDGLVLFGQYGVERFDGTGITTAPTATRWADAVRRAADYAERRLPGLFVERKGFALVLHWRQRPDLETEATDVAGGLATAYDFQLEPGRQALELRPPLDVDKGTAVEELTAGASAALFIGDDRGDVAAFDTLTRLVDEGRLTHAVRVAVRSPETPAELLDRADMAVDGPHGALELLDRLVELLDSRAGNGS